jgi:DNA-binding ferritin-like protein (Dps family)
MSESTPRASTQQALLMRVVEDLAEIKAEIRADRAWRSRVDQLLDDHETRVRALEKRAWQTAWVTAAASASLTAVVVAFINMAVTN